MNAFQFVRTYPVPVYTVSAFAFAWSNVLLVAMPTGNPGNADDYARLAPLALIGMLFGPLFAGILLTAKTGGRHGLRELWQRQIGWRVSYGWYSLALLFTPVLLTLLAVALVPLSTGFTPAIFISPDRGNLLLQALAAGVLAGFCEEIGWTGFAAPRLLKQANILRSGLLLGFIWGIWHVLADYWGAATAFGSLWLAHIVLWVVALTAFRVILVGVTARTRALLPVQVMHAGFVAGQTLLGPVKTNTHEGILWYGLFTGLLWLAVILLVITDRDVNRTVAPYRLN